MRLFPLFMLVAVACSARADNARQPVSRTPLQSLVSPLDYPAEALAKKEQGDVRLRLEVDSDGRVRSCSIVKSSGSHSLDAATCRIMSHRARFNPATDNEGLERDDVRLNRDRIHKSLIF